MLSRSCLTSRMAVRALLVPSRGMATIPFNSKDKINKTNEKDIKNEKEGDKSESIEKIPKHTQPGSKYALKNEDFADEANYQTFANEPQRDKNPTWPK